MTGQADLASRVATPQQNSCAQLKSLRTWTRQMFHRLSRYYLRLIESSLRLFALVQRNRNNRDLPHRHRLFKLGHCLGQRASQNRRSRPNLLEFQDMDQIAQATVITSIGNRALKRRINALAKQTPDVIGTRIGIRVNPIEVRRQVHRRATHSAIRTSQRLQTRYAVDTNWKTGNSDQRGVADTAIGREKSEE